MLSREVRPEAVNELQTAVARLAPLATSAQALNFLARYYSMRGQVEAGLPYAERAVATERGCWECIDTLTALQNRRATSATAKPPGDGKDESKPSIDYWGRL